MNLITEERLLSFIPRDAEGNPEYVLYKDMTLHQPVLLETEGNQRKYRIGFSYPRKGHLSADITCQVSECFPQFQMITSIEVYGKHSSEMKYKIRQALASAIHELCGEPDSPIYETVFNENEGYSRDSWQGRIYRLIKSDEVEVLLRHPERNYQDDMTRMTPIVLIEEKFVGELLEYANKTLTDFAKDEHGVIYRIRPRHDYEPEKIFLFGSYPMNYDRKAEVCLDGHYLTTPESATNAGIEICSERVVYIPGVDRGVTVGDVVEYRGVPHFVCRTECDYVSLVRQNQVVELDSRREPWQSYEDFRNTVTCCVYQTNSLPSLSPIYVNDQWAFTFDEQNKTLMVGKLVSSNGVVGILDNTVTFCLSKELSPFATEHQEHLFSFVHLHDVVWIPGYTAERQERLLKSAKLHAMMVMIHAEYDLAPGMALLVLHNYYEKQVKDLTPWLLLVASCIRDKASSQSLLWNALHVLRK